MSPPNKRRVPDIKLKAPASALCVPGTSAVCFGVCVVWCIIIPNVICRSASNTRARLWDINRLPSPRRYIINDGPFSRILFLLVNFVQAMQEPSGGGPLIRTPACTLFLHAVDGVRDIKCLFEGGEPR